MKLSPLFLILTCALLASACQNDKGSQLLKASADRDHIFGGSLVNKEDPIGKLIVALKIEDEFGNEQICTGAWIDYDWIITAAHCVNSSNTSQVKIFQILDLSEETPPLEVKKVIQHPQYKSESKRLAESNFWGKGNRFDIALLQTSQMSLAGYFHVQDIKTEELPALRTLEVAGFGAENFDLMTGVSANDGLLKKTYLEVEANSVEGVFYQKQKSTGICVGDSGSPLFSRGSEKLILVGVSNSVRNPGSSEVCRGESRFVDIAPIVPWIIENTISDR